MAEDFLVEDSAAVEQAEAGNTVYVYVGSLGIRSPFFIIWFSRHTYIRLLDRIVCKKDVFDNNDFVTH